MTNWKQDVMSVYDQLRTAVASDGCWDEHLALAIGSMGATGWQPKPKYYQLFMRACWLVHQVPWRMGGDTMALVRLHIRAAASGLCGSRAAFRNARALP